MICKNCGNEFEGKYCNDCGQKYVDKRFTIKEILHEFIHKFTHIDSGIFYLTKELFFRPGFVVKEYIEGKRKKYFNPLQFLIIVVAIASFLAINLKLFGPVPDTEELQNLSSSQLWGIEFNQFVYKYFNLILFFSVPIAAFYSRLIFRKSGFNYAENLVFNAFIAGERTVIYILLAPLFYIAGTYWYIPLAIYYISFNIYYLIAFHQFFGEKKAVTLGKYILFFILLMLTSQGLSMGVFTLFFYK